MNPLLQVLQSASNAVAGNVSGPVDLLALGLNKIGVPVGDAPVGGSEWMRRKGLLADVPQGPARVAGETLGLLSPIAAAQYAPQIARGLLAVEANAKAPTAAGKAAQQRGAIDVDAIGGVISQHKQRLLDEANDWAARSYKRNDKTVTFRGDGPGPEAMRIGAINEGRRNANVENRLAQIRALNTLSDNIAANPGKVEAIYNQAAMNARNDLPRMSGLTYDQLLDVYIGQNMAGLKDWTHGPNSVGGALRRAIEAGIKPTQPVNVTPAASSADDYLTQLFGGGQ